MKKKLIFSILLVTIIVLNGFLSACTKDNTIEVETNETDINQVAETNEVEAEDMEIETETIVFWHHYNEQSNENKVLMEILIPEFEKLHPNIKVEAVSHDWADLHNKVLVASSANDLPDVIRADSAWVPEFVEMGILLPLDNTFDDFSNISSNILEGPMNTAKVNGHYYGLGLNTNTKILFYNTKLFDEKDVDLPKTFDEFFDVATILSSNNSGQQIWGYGEPGLSGWNVCPLIWSNGGEILDETSRIANGYLNSDANVQLLTKLVELYNDGILAGFNSGDVPMTDGFAQGRYGMILDGPWKFAELRGGHAEFTDYAVARMPEGIAGSVQVLGGEDITVTTNAKEESAWEFAKFMTSEFAQVEMGKVGQIPVNLDALNNEEIKKIEDYEIFIEALKTARPRPAISEWPQVDQIITDGFVAAMLGAKEPREALDNAADEIDLLLQK